MSEVRCKACGARPSDHDHNECLSAQVKTLSIENTNQGIEITALKQELSELLAEYE